MFAMRGGARVNSGPLPQNARRRRNAPVSASNLLVLPRGGYTGPVPAWPFPLAPTVGAADAWSSLWRKPQAAAWVDMGYEHTVARLAVLMAAAMEQGAFSAVLTEVRQMEDRLGLNPAAMQRLRWKVAEPEEDADVVELVPKVRTVKAVD